MFDSRKNDVDFKIVYIRDTHPVLGFRAPTNDRLGIPADQEPKTLAERAKWACADQKKMKCTIPVVMDTMDDKTLKAYDAFPQRIYVLDKDGKVAYVSSGLVGFELENVTMAVSSMAGEPKAQPARFLLQWGSRGDGPGEFDFPIGIVVDRDGDVFVTDFYNARIQRFDSKGKFVSSFKVLPNPGGMARDTDGNFYITHFSAMKMSEEKKPDRVSVYSPEGKQLRQWGKTGAEDGEFDYPGGIAITPTGRVYVADQTNRRVQVFDTHGKFTFKWGEYGTKNGQFGGNVSAKSRVGGPQFIAIDRDGNVYTTEGSVGRVQKFTADGKFISAWGNNDDKPGGFGGTWQSRKGGLQGPVGICVGDKSHLWVSAVSGRVQEFTNDGVYLRGLGGGQGSKPGEFQAPHGIALDGRGNIYVVDAYNHRIQKFAIGR